MSSLSGRARNGEDGVKGNGKSRSAVRGGAAGREYRERRVKKNARGVKKRKGKKEKIRISREQNGGKTPSRLG